MHPDYLRSLMFGCEDGLVSTTGALVGVAIGGADGDVMAMAGVVLVAVEAISMGAGQLLSERAVHQLDRDHHDNVAVGALLMIAAYVAGGVVPLTPVLLTHATTAVWASVPMALTALVVLGVAKARAVGAPPVRSGLEVLGVGGVACAVGIAAGMVFGV